MSLLMLRAAILAQGGSAAPPLDIGTARELDVSRRPAGYTLSDGNRTAINTSGGSDYRRWVPAARAILPTDGRRYWEVLCAPGGAASFDGYMGVVSADQREDYDAGLNPITRGSIGWRGNGSLWSSTTTSGIQQLAGLPGFGAGDLLMFVLDPATASLWIGRNGIWRDNPAGDPPSWTTGSSPAFYPVIQGRNPGDGGTLRARPSAFGHPAPPGVLPLGYEDPDLRIFEAAAFHETGWDAALSLAEAEAWTARGGGAQLTASGADLFIELDLP